MRVLVATLLLACIFTVSGSIGGTTYIVRPDGSGDFPTIRAAINGVVDGDVIELANGIFMGEGNRQISFTGKAITIRSQSGRPKLCVIDCEGVDRGFDFFDYEGPNSVLAGVTIRNGTGNGAAIRCHSASPTITDCIFTGATGSGNGGGLEFGNSNSAITRCAFIDNDIPTSGGGAAIRTSTMTFEDCRFSGNSAYLGGGLVVAEFSTVTLIGCLFDGNRATTNGGAFNLTGSSAFVSGCTFVDSWASAGGGIYSFAADLVVENSIIAFGTRGMPVTCGGGGSVMLSCCDIYGNYQGDWFDCIEDQLGIDGNFSGDPLFCNLVDQRPMMLHSAAQDFGLRIDSPCLPGNHPDGIECGLIGAAGLGCRPLTIGALEKGSTGAVEVTSWGGIKTGYR